MQRSPTRPSRILSGVAALAVAAPLVCQAESASARGPSAARPTVDDPRDDVGVLPRADEGLPVPSSLEGAATDALERGLAFLAVQQASQRDGSFPTGSGDGYAPVAVTALGALALMGGGSSPERGQYGAEVAAAIDYLLARVDRSRGSPVLGYVSAESDRISRMHGHGLATLALAQAYSQSPRSKRGEAMAVALEASVQLIERTQGLEGGWFYGPARDTAHEGSVTITQVQALRAARNAGFHVNTKVIAKAVRYVERSQNEKGMFRYALGHEDTTVALTAAAVSTLNATGVYEGPVLQSGMDALWRNLLAREDGEKGMPVKWPFYERLYVAQALWQHADPRPFEQWSRLEIPRMLSRQAPDGSWSDSPFGESYATAVNCLVLAMPLELLPIFQR